jgi:hypothetical protein
MVEQAKCGLCGEPMPPGEEMFNYHGLSGPCPKAPATPPPPEAGAIPGPTERDRNIDINGWYALVCDSYSGADQQVQSLIRRLAAAERDRDDARRVLNEIRIMAIDAIRDKWPVDEAIVEINKTAANALAAPGTGGTTGGTT